MKRKTAVSAGLIAGLVISSALIQAEQKSYESEKTALKTPVSVEQMTEVKAIGDVYGQDPVLYEDYLYMVNAPWGGSPTLKQINKTTMELVKETDICAPVGYTPFLEAGDGQIFVPLADGRIQAFDALTLESTWISEAPAQSENAASRLTYHDGYLYYGIGGYAPRSGDPFICLKTEDVNTAVGDEINPIVWSCDLGSGYYWSEAVIVQDAIVFAGYEGKLILHSLKEDVVYDVLDTDLGDITNSLCFDGESGTIVIATKSGKVMTVECTGRDFVETSVNEVSFTGQFSSSPVADHGRVYIAGGSSMQANEVFTILDIETLDTICQIDEIAGQANPVLSTAYEGETHLYMINFSCDENGSTVLYHIIDREGQNSASFQKMVVLDPSISNNWWNGSLIMDENAFYAYNGNGTVVRIGFDLSESMTVPETKPAVDTSIM